MNNGTQVTDIEKKEDYPKFKVGKKITNLVTTERELTPAEVAEQHPDNNTEYRVVCKDNQLRTIFEEYFSSEREAFKYAEEAVKSGDYERLDIYAPGGVFIAGVVKSIINESSLKESWYDDRLPAELKDEIKQQIEDMKSKHGDSYPTREWIDNLWWELNTSNNSNTEQERRNRLNTIKKYYDAYDSNTPEFEKALDLLKKNNVSLWPHSAPRLASDGTWEFTGMKGISHGQQSTSVHVTKDGQVIEESDKSYNYIGTDTGKVGNHTNTHEEKVYIVYDKYGEIGEYPTRAQAQEVIDEWYIDPELYTDKEDANLHIEEDTIDVSNTVIHVKDDLASD